MTAGQGRAGSPARVRQAEAALKLVCASVCFGIASGAASLSAGWHGHSLGVFAVGLSVIADVTGSAVLIWRFWSERSGTARTGLHEDRAATVVALALAIVSVVLLVQSVAALVTRSRPGTSSGTLIVAGLCLCVLTPLAYAKRRLGRQLGSRALQGDGSLSGIGAATSLLALAALALYHAAGWWWADRVAALVVAAIAGAQAWQTMPRGYRRGLID